MYHPVLPGTIEYFHLLLPTFRYHKELSGNIKYIKEFTSVSTLWYCSHTNEYFQVQCPVDQLGLDLVGGAGQFSSI